MYSDRIDNSLGVSIKTCNRIKIQEDSSQSSKCFIRDTGYQLKYDYKIHGTVYQFILNDFEDLKSIIPVERQNKQYKVELMIYDYLE